MRLLATNDAGTSQASRTVSYSTSCSPPPPCAPPRVVGQAKARAITLDWSAVANGHNGHGTVLKQSPPPPSVVCEPLTYRLQAASLGEEFQDVYEG